MNSIVFVDVLAKRIILRREKRIVLQREINQNWKAYETDDETMTFQLTSNLKLSLKHLTLKKMKVDGKCVILLSIDSSNMKCFNNEILKCKNHEIQWFDMCKGVPKKNIEKNIYNVIKKSSKMSRTALSDASNVFVLPVNETIKQNVEIFDGYRKITLSEHARIRAIQRGISGKCISDVLDNSRDTGEKQNFEGVTVVMADNKIVTVYGKGVDMESLRYGHFKNRHKIKYLK